jgi:SAM-dependent methyltransferase
MMVDTTDRLATFESLVLSQKPTDLPWDPVTPYDFESRRSLEEPQAELIASVLQPTKVCDAGCGYGHLIQLLRDRHIKAYGFDLIRRWPESLHSKVVRADLAANQFRNPWPGSDLVICREVLEHLTVRQITRAVRNLVACTSRYIYVTTRFHPKPEHLLDVATSDDLDPTHISLLNQDLLRALFVLEGCQRRPPLEHTMDWLQKGRVLVYERVA